MTGNPLKRKPHNIAARNHPTIITTYMRNDLRPMLLTEALLLIITDIRTKFNIYKKRQVRLILVHPFNEVQ